MGIPVPRPYFQTEESIRTMEPRFSFPEILFFQASLKTENITDLMMQEHANLILPPRTTLTMF